MLHVTHLRVLKAFLGPLPAFQSRGVVEPCLTALKPYRHRIPEAGLVRSTSTAYH